MQGRIAEAGWLPWFAAGWRRVSRHDLLHRFLPAAVLTCAVALCNRFPLTYPDTGNYVDNAYGLAHGQQPWFFFRPLAYGAFLVPFARAQGLWLVPLVQGCLVAWVVDLTLRSAGVRLGTRAFLGLFAALSAFSSLSWVSGQLMPDVFTGLIVLLSFVMLWGGQHLRPSERWLAGGLLGFAIATHLSHLPLYGLMLGIGLALRAPVAAEAGKCRSLPALAVTAAAPLVLALGLVIAPNYWFYGEPVLSPSSSLFALARLVGDGSAQRYLDRACPVREYLLCTDRASLRADVDWFLWDAAGPRMRYDPAMQRGDSTFLREAPDIVSGTLRQEWPWVIRSSLRGATTQLVSFGIQRGEQAYSRTVAAAMRRLGPAALRAYLGSRQVRKTLPVALANVVQYIGVTVGVLLLLGCLPALHGPTHRPLRVLIATAVAGAVCNALVIASLATVHPRYQSRVVWLVPLVAAVAAHQVMATLGRRRSSVSGSELPDRG